MEPDPKKLPKVQFKPLTVKGFAAGPWQLVAFLMCVVGLPGALAAMKPASADTPAGTLHLRLDSDPKTLNPITLSDHAADQVQSYVMSSLLTRREDTWEWQPSLAASWKMAPDGKKLTFKIRKGIKWHDGEPLTVEDVKYSFDVYFEGRFQAPWIRVLLDPIREIRIVDPSTVEFDIKEVRFKNLDVIAGQLIIPKHIYAKGDPSDTKFNSLLIGTGPYRLERWERSNRIVLTRNKEYFGDRVPYFSQRFGFEKIDMKVVSDESVAFQMLLRGDFDFLPLTPDQFTLQTSGEPWGTRVKAVKVENSSSDLLSGSFIAWNAKVPLFHDPVVRNALSRLVNRDLIIEKIFHGMVRKAYSPFGTTSPVNSPRVKPVEYDPKEALRLLMTRGWKSSPQGLVRVVDGKESPFEFTILCGSAASMRFLTLIQEDMKKAGIQMKILTLEFASMLKLVNEFKFDGLLLSLGGDGPDPDPTSPWYSKGGYFMEGYSSPELDRKIERIRSTLNDERRHKLQREFHEIIAADQPYSFLFSPKYFTYAYNTRLLLPQETLKFSIGLDTWRLR